MEEIYHFDSIESLIEYLNSDECECKNEDIVTFSARTINGDMIKCCGYISSLGLNPKDFKGGSHVKEIERIRQQILENIKEETLVCPMIKPNIIPKLLAPVEPMEKPFPDIEIENRRWFENFGREMCRRKRNYINKANPKKGSANYETQRIRNTEQIVHRQHRCQER